MEAPQQTTQKETANVAAPAKPAAAAGQGFGRDNRGGFDSRNRDNRFRPAGGSGQSRLAAVDAGDTENAMTRAKTNSIPNFSTFRGFRTPAPADGGCVFARS